jgi:hypothetical protein
MATKPVFDDVPAWPGENPASAPPAPRDHNKPPLEELIPIEFREALLAEKPDFLTVLDRYLGVGDPNSEDYVEGAVDRAKCTNDDELGLCGEVVKNLRRAEQHVDATHKTVKQPYLDGGRLVDAEKNRLFGRIRAGRDKVQALQDEYNAEKRREELKRQREAEEERRKLEELARENNLEAALPPPPPAPVKAEPVRSDGGATVSTSIEYVGVVEDYTKAFRKVKDDAAVREAIDKAIQRLVKAAKGKTTIPGVRIDERVKTISR